MRAPAIAVVTVASALVFSCSDSSAPEADAHGATAATSSSREAIAAAVRGLPLDDPQDFEDAQRGRIGGEEDVVIRDAAGKTLWDTRSYDFVRGEPPPSVNPSLWRQAKLNGQHGLFEVTDGIYQVRGYDIANMTWIRGRTGWIVVDTLTT